jgi:predicted acetyltransferase
MFEKRGRELDRLFERSQHRLVGYEEDGRIRGYLVFRFDQGETFILNDIHIQELIYEHKQALWQLSTFLHSQADQIRHIYVNTQDEYFHHLLLDPRNGSGRLIPDVYHETNAQGVGLMYRVVNVPGILELLSDRDFGGQTCTLRLTVADSFLPENSGTTIFRFQDGRLQPLDESVLAVGPCNAEINLGIADLSSLLVGTVSLKQLHRYGLAAISDEAHVDDLNRLFFVPEKPVCTTGF